MKAGKSPKRARAAIATPPVDQASAGAPPADIPAAPAAASSSSIVLVSDCTARNAEALHAGLLGLVGSTAEVSLDMSAVERVDTVCLQLLGAFVRERTRGGKSTRWHGRSDALLQAAALLGLGETLGVGAAA